MGEAELIAQIGVAGPTLAAVLLAWHRCERNHKALRALVHKLIDRQEKR